MNNINLKIAIGVLLLCLGASKILYAQSVECTQRLNEASILYDEGRLPEVLETLNKGKCLKEGFSREQQARAYRLMALVYIFLDDELNAEDAIISLLHADPEHPYSPENDPAEFIVLYKKFRYKPIFRVGGYFGVNQSSVNSLSQYGTFSFNPDLNDPNSTISKSFSPGIGLQMGATFEYQPIKEMNILKDFEVMLRVQMSWQNYLVNYPIITAVGGAPGADFKVSELKESMTWFSTPLALRYNIPINNIIPYIIGGVSADFLLGSKMTGSREGTTSVRLTDLDLKAFDMREKFNWSYFGGAGVKFTVDRTKSFFVEGTYNSGGQNFVNGKNRNASQELNYNIAHTDDDKSLNSIRLSVGFIWSVYKPIKYSEKKLARDQAREMKRNDRR